MIEVSRVLSEVPLFGLAVCLISFFPRDPGGEGPAPPEEDPPASAPVGPDPPEGPSSDPEPCRGPVSLAVPAVVARALMALLPFVIRVLRRCGVLEKDAPDVAQEVLVHVLPWWAPAPP